MHSVLINRCFWGCRKVLVRRVKKKKWADLSQTHGPFGLHSMYAPYKKDGNPEKELSHSFANVTISLRDSSRAPQCIHQPDWVTSQINAFPVYRTKLLKTFTARYQRQFIIKLTSGCATLPSHQEYLKSLTLPCRILLNMLPCMTSRQRMISFKA